MQDVHIIYGKENTTIWCEFIAGSLNNTCHIFVLRGNSEFYNKTILKSTTLCLLKNDQVLIYDDVSQGSPTFSRIISLTTCGKLLFGIYYVYSYVCARIHMYNYNDLVRGAIRYSTRYAVHCHFAIFYHNI